MTLKAPKVLVVITCHNYAGMVADAMQSVANQTYGDFECVVVDDASDDGSFDVIERTREHIGDCRFATMKLSRRRGQMNAFATGLQDRPSHLVAFLDADDYWDSAFLETHVRAHLNTICAAPISCSDMWIVDKGGTALEGTFLAFAKPRFGDGSYGGRVIAETSCPAICDGTVGGSGPALPLLYMPRELHSSWHWTATSAMVFRRDFIDLAIPADRKPTERHADYFLAHLAHMLGGSLIIPQSLGVYRLHGQNLHARLPRIGSFQNFGIDPKGALDDEHDRLALHVLRNWTSFTDLVGVVPLADALRRYCSWQRLETLAASADIPPATIESAIHALRRARVQDKRGLRRRFIKLGDAIVSRLPASWRRR